MKARSLALAVLVFLGSTAYAQETEAPFLPYFSLELGTGMAPIHTLVNLLGMRNDSALADQGLTSVSAGAWAPSFSLSAAWHSALRWEFVVTGGLSWCHYRVNRYGTFGVDPQGKPRYDLNTPEPAGWKNSDRAYALFFQARRFWNPTQKVKLYSAAGFGAYLDGSTIRPVPSLTPIAVRFGTGPLKFSVEHTFSPAATALQLCLGWTF